MKLRTKISVYFAPIILVAVAVVYLLNYVVIRRELTHNAQSEVAQIGQNMHRSVEDLLRTAISNYLRGITEKNLDYIERQYQLVQRGVLTKNSAMERIQSYFDHQKVGASGYLVALEEDTGRNILALHPYLAGTDCTETEGCRAWVNVRNGYTEYPWKNPEDNSLRMKAAFVGEFAPWNLIVGASSYKDEFVKLIRIDDLGRMLAPVRINKSGYFVVFNEDHEILIHPVAQLVGKKSISNSRGEDIMQLMAANEKKYFTYRWKNPGEKKERMKYAYVDKLDDFGWYLVATGYLSEVYGPVAYLGKLTVGMIVLAGSVLALIIIKVSKTIATPLQRLEDGINEFYTTRKPFRWQENAIREMDVLGTAYARMTEELNAFMADLEEKNRALAASEKEIAKSRMFLDSIINSMPSVIIGVDSRVVVNQWNSGAEGIAECSGEKAMGRLLYDVLPGLVPYGEQIQQGMADRKVVTFSLQWGREDSGRSAFFEITVYPLVSAANGGAVIRMDDVTERVEMEQHLRQSQKMDAVGQLAGGIAHDFNNMLGGIVGASELLRLKVAPEDLKLVEIITEASNRAGELIEKLLAFSRKGDISFSTVDMHGVIRNSVEILEHSLDKRILIETDLGAEPATVMGEWSQLQNVLLNIGINSGHAMPTGGVVRFSTKLVTLGKQDCESSQFDLHPGEYLQISVRDTGQGIARENLRRIFEPFYTTREQDEGSGLGLAAVYGVVQQHHGAVHVSSELGEGTEFVIELPLSREAAVAPGPQQELVFGTGTILIVDDEPVVRMTARLMLEKLGYDVLEAENGQEGLVMYEQHRGEVNMVLLDMLMPVMDGVQCFHKLQKIDPEVNVVISSGFTREADLESLKREGLTNFVRKPLNMAVLGEAVNDALRKGKGATP